MRSPSALGLATRCASRRASSTHLEGRAHRAQQGRVANCMRRAHRRGESRRKGLQRQGQRVPMEVIEWLGPSEKMCSSKKK